MKSPGPASVPLRIVVVNPVTHPGAGGGTEGDAAFAEQARRSAALRIGLLESGYDLVASLPADVFLPERILQLQPDMIIVDSESDARDILEHIVIATRDERRPIVLFTEDDAQASMDAAIDAGVSAYIVAGLHAERVKPVLDVALARFRREQKLLDELQGTRQKLAERKIVDRAKGLLMERYRLTEDQAYQRLRSMAMNKNMKLAEIAQRLVDVEDLLG
ncbi:ANTAR domain-containing response regulator [Massilia yuzhufengensis]|uniref:Response regulator receiver and ANTAR domain protein n=1 Tax=Massilia yuzhufengensis TaxID=1164594 RepID=A0A1I1FVQ8_9BURK|nr:ANTAR domain-containing protein [Massilia yuzhufengensis]SFC01718.1 response regulator receiver and ANTAR domain protein [Massilia yuzhufengensis]